MSLSSSTAFLAPSVSSLNEKQFSGTSYASLKPEELTDSCHSFSSVSISSFTPDFDSPFLTQSLNRSVSSFIGQIVHQYMSHAISHFTASQNQTPLCSCPLCQKSNLFALTTTLLSKDQQHPTTLTSKSIPQELIDSVADGTLQADVTSTIYKMTTFLDNVFRFRQTELISAILFFTRILDGHANCFVFYYLFRSSLKTLFLATVVVAHKCLTDTCYTLRSFASVFGVPLPTLNQFEIAVLELLDNKCTISLPEFTHLLALITRQKS